MVNHKSKKFMHKQSTGIDGKSFHRIDAYAISDKLCGLL